MRRCSTRSTTRSTATAARVSRRARSNASIATPAVKLLWVPSARQKRQKRDRRNEPMHCEELTMHRTLRCGARTRSGYPCQSPAVRGKRRCRMHGGAAGSGAPIGNKNAFRHGRYTAEANTWRRGLAELIRQSRATVAELEDGG